MPRYSSRIAMHEKRTPPFGIVEDGNRRLGNYTYSHETVNKPTYSCYSIRECEVCSPLEKVNCNNNIT